ncbi:DUF1707 domain-containing protein [Dactylosporangium sp. NPDC050588]|uniref:DUF1707 SHOCT-like domain-containing protein n=1 Tax=Dactylosporangium sp. NPDC050588 TaxID=3157211 RepID=UPI0033DD2F7C
MSDRSTVDDMYPSPSFRASDADREAVVAHLGTCLSEGRLSLSEFDARTRHTYAARTWGELLQIVRDLPPLPAAPAQPKADPQPVAPVLALVFGIFSLPAAACGPVGVIAGIVAVVLGVVALLRADGAGKRRGLAIAGVLCGTFGILFSIAMVILYATID